MDYIDKVNDYIISREVDMTPLHLVVMEVLVSSFNSGLVLTQGAIIKRLKSFDIKLGSHKVHESGSEESSTHRQLRSIIESLRKELQIPICSSAKGFYLPRSEVEFMEYMRRTERTRIATAKSHVATFNSLASKWAPEMKTRISVLPAGEGTVSDDEV